MANLGVAAHGLRKKALGWIAANAAKAAPAIKRVHDVQLAVLAQASKLRRDPFHIAKEREARLSVPILPEGAAS
eukprot:1445389-Alexandrium_andersonii.AAC.1